MSEWLSKQQQRQADYYENIGVLKVCKELARVRNKSEHLELLRLCQNYWESMHRKDLLIEEAYKFILKELYESK